MARIIATHDTDPTTIGPMEKEWIYNGLDCCLTNEILDALRPQLDDVTGATYSFSRELQAPVLEMRLRGVLVDKARRAKVLDDFHDSLDIVERQLERIVLEGVGLASFKWGSHPDRQRLFYDVLQIPAVMKGGRRTTDRATLEKLVVYPVATAIINHIITLDELRKKIGVLRTATDEDGRMRTSYNIAGTSTGRFSSSFTEFGTGGNLQNIEESLRSILIADPGMIMAKFDAKSGESFVVGAIEWNLFNDDRYLSACESGDPHTAVARICWPGLPWTGDLKHDKNIAETPYYRHYTYRFMCKKLGHGSNYGGKPRTLSEQSKLPIGVVEAFQPRYFEAFPAHQQWQGWVDNQLRRYGVITSLLGRRRHFFGRRSDDSTLREAIAYDPQSSLADLVNTAMLQIWRLTKSDHPLWSQVQLLLQDHDALTFQFPEGLVDDIVPLILSALVIPVPLANGRTLRIPYDAKIGFNRGDWSKNNPEGLKDWKPGEKRQRQPKVHLLDRPIRSLQR